MRNQVMLQLVSTEDTIANWTAKTISDHYCAFHDISASAASACAKLLQACAHCWPRSHALARAAVMEPATCGLCRPNLIHERMAPVLKQLLMI